MPLDIGATTSPLPMPTISRAVLAEIYAQNLS